MAFKVHWDRGSYVWLERIHDHEPGDCPAHIPFCPDHGTTPQFGGMDGS